MGLTVQDRVVKTSECGWRRWPASFSTWSLVRPMELAFPEWFKQNYAPNAVFRESRRQEERRGEG